MASPYASFVAIVELDDPEKQQAWLRVALLIIIGTSVHLSLSPPNARPPKGQLVQQKSLFERRIIYFTLTTRILIWLYSLSDAFATLFSVYPHIPLTPYLVHALYPFDTPTALSSMDGMLVSGALLTLAGALLRRACFSTLGRLFTFELTIDPEHKLATRGPYAFVRHPSYTGLFLTLLGPSLAALSPTSLPRLWLAPLCTPGAESALTECVPQARGVLVRTLLALWALKCVYVVRNTVRRTTSEDEELKAKFGKTWEEYAERTRWRLVPGVY